jgi:hypothetical protein
VKTREVTNTAVLHVCGALYQQGLKPTHVGHEAFFLMVWQYIFFRIGKLTPYPLATLVLPRRFLTRFQPIDDSLGRASPLRRSKIGPAFGPKSTPTTTRESKTLGTRASSNARSLALPKAWVLSHWVVRLRQADPSVPVATTPEAPRPPSQHPLALRLLRRWSQNQRLWPRRRQSSVAASRLRRCQSPPSPQSMRALSRANLRPTPPRRQAEGGDGHQEIDQ